MIAIRKSDTSDKRRDYQIRLYITAIAFSPQNILQFWMLWRNVGPTPQFLFNIFMARRNVETS